MDEGLKIAKIVLMHILLHKSLHIRFNHPLFEGCQQNENPHSKSFLSIPQIAEAGMQ